MSTWVRVSAGKHQGGLPGKEESCEEDKRAWDLGNGIGWSEGLSWVLERCTNVLCWSIWGRAFMSELHQLARREGAWLPVLKSHKNPTDRCS